MSNPFLKPLPDTGIPAFDQIEFEHYREAFNLGFAEHTAEIEAIINNPEPATFLNTVEAMERSGSQLRRVVSVFSNLTSSDTNEEIQALEMEVVPEYAVHKGKISSNPALFARIKAVVEACENLKGEEKQLLDETYQSFVRAGAELTDTDRERVNAIGEELAGLTTEFGQNVLKDTNEFELVLEGGEDIAGLPDFVLAMG